MKQFITWVLTLFCMAPSVFGQNADCESHRSKGYTGDVSMGVLHFPGGGYENRPVVFTTHGYTFDNNLFIGAGLGIDVPMYKTDGSGVQYLYLSCGYDIDHGRIDSYVKCKFGMSYGNHGDNQIGAMLMPEYGLKYNNLSLGLGVMADSECQRNTYFKYQWMKTALIFSVCF
ncbi:MAG: hypothetical protein KBT08_08900 [Bacteroidales bacterium]|nr:hypothetical protein [Candidatus Cryptobacteroides onthequi]